MTDRGREERGFGGDLFGMGDRLALVAGLVLAVSAFTGWYTGPGEGVTVSVLGWHTGVLGKLVFLVGLAIVVLAALRELGVAMPTAVPDSLVAILFGMAGTILVLIRVIAIPDDYFFASRGIGIWIALVSAIAVVVGGLLQATEDL